MEQYRICATGCTESVSYTHLDVYKRQGLCKAIVAGEDLRKDEVLEKHADWVDAVSYTHLDVYKRQVQNRPETSAKSYHVTVRNGWT